MLSKPHDNFGTNLLTIYITSFGLVEVKNKEALSFDFKVSNAL